MQRVSNASVEVDGIVVGAIDLGVLVLFCADPQDNSDLASYFAKKIADIRIFEDAFGKMNLSVKDVGGSVLVVSQFTLAAKWRKGNRPSFSAAAHPDTGEWVYDLFCYKLREEGVHLETGHFGASMRVNSTNEGPVTIVMDNTQD